MTILVVRYEFLIGGDHVSGRGGRNWLYRVSAVSVN